MMGFESSRGVRTCEGVTRRAFLQAGGLALGLSATELVRLAKLAAAPASRAKACIQICLIGGPSQLDTWDPKPDAPSEIRGPFRPIRTNVLGVTISEHFPRMARIADRFAILRSVHHEEAPIHETGQQLMQTGRLSRDEFAMPHVGAVAARLLPSRADVSSWMMLPTPIRDTGVNISHGQGAGFLGSAFEAVVASPEGFHHARSFVDTQDTAERRLAQAGTALNLSAEPARLRDGYGRNTFGQSCLLARRLIEHGTRFVTVNMFDTVFNRITWDCHANGSDLGSTLDDYRETLCPMFDRAFTSLLTDLQQRGLLDDTLVVAAGEFGRTPRLNSRGGRDHWPGVWSILMAGGGVRGGQVIGSSDAHAAEPRDRPIYPAEIVATVNHSLGIDPATPIGNRDGAMHRLVEAAPISDLF